MNPATDPSALERIRLLNDSFRKSGIGGRSVMTAGIAALSDELLPKIIAQVRAFDAFTEGNDPHGEHDFGSFEIEGLKVFWKIDYLDTRMEYGSEDPSDPRITTRVLTIMLADEY